MFGVHSRIPATILLVGVYALVFVGVLLSDRVPPPSQDDDGLDFDSAYKDLHEITTQPHPFNSHANDLIRGYVLERLQNIAMSYPHVEVVDDIVSAASYVTVTYSRGASFEGNNILVKVEGTEPQFMDNGGVLFSAHLDSVSTGSGATDDGMGVASLMALVKHLTTHRTRRTAIFNINNGEEDGLNGAHVFLEHPWSKIPDTFLNLEGAGAGGRPILFRATSTAPVRSFKNSFVRHPHGDVISADAFGLKLIASNTDYSVYIAGLNGTRCEGLDFAFYKDRSKYHSKYDTIPGADGAKGSLGLMMQTVRGVAESLLNDDRTHVEHEQNPEPAVYFDVFGQAFFVFTQKALISFNLVLLALGPIVLSVVYALPDEFTWGAIRDFSWIAALTQNLTSSLSGLPPMELWVEFWVALLVAVISNVTFVYLLGRVNPFVVYSQPFAVVISLLSLSFLATALPFNFSLPFLSSNSRLLEPVQRKISVILQLYLLSWLFLVISTVLLWKARVGGFYFCSVWNVCLVLGTICVLLELRRSRSGNVNTDPTEDSQATERTPLLSHSQNGKHSTTRFEGDAKSEGGDTLIAQVLIVVPLPVLLVLQTLILMKDALHQTLTNGGSPLVVNGGLASLSLLIFLMGTPFTIRLHRSVVWLTLFTFVVSTAYISTVFPFSQDAPMTVYFQQNVTVDLKSGANPISTTTLIGLTPFLEEKVIPALPSSWGKDIRCTFTNGERDGRRRCEWNSGSTFLPSPVGDVQAGFDAKTPADKWFTANATRLSPTSARFWVKGVNTRTCKLFFDTPVMDFKVYEPTMLDDNDDGHQLQGVRSLALQPAFPIPQSGLKELGMHSRSWGRAFIADVFWNATDAGGLQPFSGQIGCAWAEYDSSTLGLGLPAGSTASIPAYEEVLKYLPKWAASIKYSDALVSVAGKFVV